jgi:arginine/lysine/ornithine decarboxylase
MKTFAVLPITAPNKTTGGFINTDTSTIVSREFTDPIRLTSLTVKILDYNGELYDFGAPSGSTTKALQHNFMLKIESSLFF